MAQYHLQTNATLGQFKNTTQSEIELKIIKIVKFGVVAANYTSKLVLVYSWEN